MDAQPGGSADTTNECEAERRFKRRSLIAGAAAVTAAIIATEPSQAALATAGTGADGNFVLGSNDINNTSNYASSRTQLVSGLTFRGAVLLDCSASPFQSSGDPNAVGVSGACRGTAAGVYGTDSVGSKPSGFPAGLNAGVYGYTSTTGHSGVRGDGGSAGIGVSGISFNSNAVLGTTLGSSFNSHPAILGLGYGCAVEGDVPAGSTLTNTVAVNASNGAGGAGSIGVRGTATQGIGGSFQGGLAPLRLVPAATPGAPTAGAHQAGELFVDSAGALFFCRADGTPGTWIPLGVGGVTSITAPGGTAVGAVALAAGANVTLTEAGNTITIASSAVAPAAGPTLSFLPTPERFVDTRIALGGVQGPVPAVTTHTFSMTGRNGQSDNAALQIPDDASAIVGNLTVVGAEGVPLGSFLTVWPGGPLPTVSNINFGPSTVTGAVANSFMVALASTGGHGALDVYNHAACDYIIDVTGYYK